VRNGQALITRYRIGWLLLVGLFAIVVVWLVVLGSPPPVAPGDVRSAVESENPPAQRLKSEDQMLERLKADMTELELTISAGEGQLRLRVWAAAASKDGARYEIDDGLLQFEMESRDTLLLRVEDGALEYSAKALELARTLESLWWMRPPQTGVLWVNGARTGRSVGTEQHFETTGLVWDQFTGQIRTATVEYRAGGVAVSGQCMCLDLLTGEINFEGQVEASV